MITVRSVAKRYDRVVLDGVDCHFPERNVTFLMGGNGAGKTTLFKCLLGLEACEGEVRFDGRPVEQVRGELAALFEDTPFYDRLSGWRNLQLLADGPRFSRQEVDRLLGVPFEPLLDRPVRTYSSGQRKRLAMAMVQLMRPRYVLLDEVASGLDVPAMDMVTGTIRHLARSATVIATGHQFDFYAPLIDRVLVLDGGRIEEVTWHGGNGEQLEAVYRRYAMAGSH